MPAIFSSPTVGIGACVQSHSKLVCCVRFPPGLAQLHLKGVSCSSQGSGLWFGSGWSRAACSTPPGSYRICGEWWPSTVLDPKVSALSNSIIVLVDALLRPFLFALDGCVSHHTGASFCVAGNKREKGEPLRPAVELGPTIGVCTARDGTVFFTVAEAVIKLSADGKSCDGTSASVCVRACDNFLLCCAMLLSR